MFESNLVCAPCRHGKMIVASHSPVNAMIMKCPGQLLHMDTISPSRVLSMGGKWYVLVIVDVFLESKDEVFEHFQNLALRLSNEHLSYPSLRKWDRSLYTCAQDVQFTCIVTI
jgi:hypothetical protein